MCRARGQTESQTRKREDVIGRTWPAIGMKKRRGSARTRTCSLNYYLKRRLALIDQRFRPLFPLFARFKSFESTLKGLDRGGTRFGTTIFPWFHVQTVKYRDRKNDFSPRFLLYCSSAGLRVGVETKRWDVEGERLIWKLAILQEGLAERKLEKLKMIVRGTTTEVYNWTWFRQISRLCYRAYRSIRAHLWISRERGTCG